MEQSVIDKLYEEFKVEIKPGGQGFKYVRTSAVLDRLNKAFNCNWGVHIKSHELIDDEALVLVAVHLYNDEGHVLASQEGFGSAKKFRNVELGNIYKSATSRAIKSAVRNWGVALFLDDASQSAPASTGMPSQGMPSAPPSQPAPASTPATGGVPNPMPPASVPSTPTTPSVAPTAPPSTPMGPPQMTVPSNTTMTQEATSTPTVPSTPSTPTTSVPSTPSLPVTPAPTVEQPGGLPPMSAVPGQMPTAEEGLTEITMVQKVAIQSKLTARNMTFDQVATEFYANRDSTVPATVDEMLYVDALDLVVSLNSK